MRIRNQLLLVFFCGMVVACGKSEPKDPMAELTPEHKTFIFGNGRVAFLGKPLNGRIGCDFKNAEQGYVFKIENGGVFFDSLRPSGIITQRVVSMTSNGDGIDIVAANGTESKFNLTFSNITDQSADISYDNIDTSIFLRCEK